MKKTILLALLLFPILLFSITSQDRYFKAKLSSNNKLDSVRFRIRNPMIGDERYSNQRNLEESYITHITARNEHGLLLDISTSSYLREYPIIEYQLRKSDQSKPITYTITDNSGHKKSYAVDFKQNKITKQKVSSLEKPFIDYRKLKSKLWSKLSVEEAISELYGVVKDPIEGRISLTGPEETFCEQRIPVNISSEIDLESVAIFTDKTEKPTLAVFSISEGNIINYKIYIKIYHTCTDYTIYVIGKDRNGQYYKESSKGWIACGDSCGGGG